MLKLYSRFEALLDRIPNALVLLFVRITAAQPFWFSGRSKVEGWFTMRPEVVDLFRYEYDLPLVSPEIAAPMATVAEHVLPILLVLGLFTRFSAAGLLIMTAVIQLLVYPDAWWTVHSLWTALLLVPLAMGGGAISLDSLLMKNNRSEAA